MLVLSRKVGEKIIIGGQITIVVQRVSKGRVAIAIEAPHSIPVLRGELAPFGIAAENKTGGETSPAAEEPPRQPSSSAEAPHAPLRGRIPNGGISNGSVSNVRPARTQQRPPKAEFGSPEFGGASVRPTSASTATLATR